jgi:hypothetical protein
MLSRRRLLAGLIGAAVLGGPAFAQDDRVTRAVLRQLERQGFEVIELRKTLLGRVRIIASRGANMRELVFDPRTGAILRDFLSNNDDGPVIPSIGDFDDASDPDDEGDEDDDDDDDGDGDDDSDDDGEDAEDGEDGEDGDDDDDGDDD